MNKTAPVSVSAPVRGQAPETGVSARGGMLVMLCLAGAVGSSAACSSSSSSSADPFPDFVGTWRVEFGTAAQPQSTSTLSCTSSMIMVDLPLWDRLILQPGTVSDLIETAGPSSCQFVYAVDTKTNIASVPTSDPFTGQAVTCSPLVNTSTDPTTNDVIDLFLDIVPKPWDFKLLAPVKGKAPTAQLIGMSTGTLSAFDETAGAAAGSDTTCTYSVSMNLTKIAE